MSRVYSSGEIEKQDIQNIALFNLLVLKKVLTTVIKTVQMFQHYILMWC